MEQRRIGSTDLVVSAIGFGTAVMSTTAYGEIDVTEAARAVDQAIDLGVTLFDTAEVYGPHHAETILATALGRRREEVTLVTKVGFAYGDGMEIAGRDSSYSNIISSAEGCLRRLDTDVIDLMLVHWGDPDTPFEETICAFERLAADGKIRYYGVSNFDVAMMRAWADQGRLAANQVGYHVFDRRMEAAVLPYCRQTGTGFMAYGTMAYGLASGAFTPETTFVEWDWRSRGMAVGLPLFTGDHFLGVLRAADRLQALAADHGRTLPQLAIAWVLDNPAVSVALVGMRNPAELEENVAAAGWKLTDEIRGEIDRILVEEGVPTYVDGEQVV